jgi:hypothetical protein
MAFEEMGLLAGENADYSNQQKYFHAKSSSPF